MTRCQQVIYASVGLTILCATIFLTHAVAFRLGEDYARAHAAELFLALEQGDRLQLARERLMDDVERDIRFCHDRLAKLQVVTRAQR